MKRNVAFLVFVIFSLLFSLNGLFAQRGGRAQEVIEVRLASSLPRHTSWGTTLDRIASEWARVTNNQVRLRVLHGGTEGGEGKMLSSLSADNIQAALFTSAGLSEFCPAVMTLSVPFMIRNNNELDLVLKDVLPILDRQMNGTNYVIITWSKGGWVNFFSKETVFTPDDLRRQKIGSSPELRDINTIFKTMGFQVVEAEIIDTGTKLASNMINSTYSAPELIAPNMLHKVLTNMLDMPVAPVMGAIVMNRVTWNKISQDHQRELLRVTQRIASEFQTTIERTSANAVSVMQRDGLKLNRPTAAQEELWRSEVGKALPMLLGTTFDRAIYDQINGILQRARNRQ